MDKERVLIIGAGGFIGTNLTRRLILDEYRLICADLPGVDMTIAGEHDAKIVRGSLGDDPVDIYRSLDGVDTVFHLVSTTCPSNSNSALAKEAQDNIVATIRLLDECVKAKVKKVVFFSSGGTVYGKEHDGVLSEDDDTYPISGYGIQKLVIEKYLYLYRELYGLDYRIVRLSNPYGPYQRPDGVQGLIAACTWRMLKGEPIEIYGDGSVVRDYIYIDDAIEGIINIMSDKARHRLYNLGSGTGVSVKEIVETVGRVLNTRPDVINSPARQVDVPKNVLNIDRYVSEFGSPINIELDEGIWRLAQFYERVL